MDYILEPGADEILGQHFSTFYPEADVTSGKPQRDLDAAGAGGVVRPPD